jgi:small subunit ribosomal protein S17
MMADEEKTETEEQPEEATEEEPQAEEAPAEEQAAEEAPAEEPREEADDDESGPPTAKQIRKRKRSEFTGPVKPARGPDERANERAEARGRNAAERRRHRTSRRQRRGEPQPGTPPADRAAGPKKVRTGTVVSTKAAKTITVRIEVTHRHPTYEKVVRRSDTLHAHDEAEQAQQGDVVRIVETRPLSRTKRWRLVEVLERAR